MLVQFLILIIGFFFLIKGAGLLVDGSSSLAAKFNIPQALIGLTIVAFGTSSPELFINLLGNHYHLPDLGFGNVIGSSITLMLLVVGICAFINPIKIDKQILKRELPIVAFAIIALILLANNLFKNPDLALSRLDGIILLLFFIIFLYSTLGKAKHINHDKIDKHKLFHSIILIIIGITGLALGGNFVLFSGFKIARMLNVSDAVIGLSLLAIGTTLPELIASAIAARKNNADLAIGNIVGSIAFNNLFILGLTSIISPIPYNKCFNCGLGLILLTIVIFYYFSFNKNDDRKIQRWEGVILVMLYFIFLGFSYYII